MQKRFRLLAAGVLLPAFPQAASSVAKQTPLRLAPFSSIEIRSGGHVVMRHAPTHRVTLVKGSQDYTRVHVTDGVLVIDKCRVKCPRGYELDIEIMVPAVSRLSLANGGWIESRGSFGPQADLTAAVAHGGRIDIRAIPAERVTASVEHGGRILTVPRRSLIAKVTQGGVVTYWGNAQVKSLIERGGVVDQGTPEELNLPLSELGPSVVSPIHSPRHDNRKQLHRER